MQDRGRWACSDGPLGAVEIGVGRVHLVDGHASLLTAAQLRPSSEALPAHWLGDGVNSGQVAKGKALRSVLVVAALGGSQVVGPAVLAVQGH